MHNNKLIKIILIVIVISVGIMIVATDVVQAGKVQDLLKTAGDAAQYKTTGNEVTSFSTLVGKIIRAFLSLLGTFFVGLAVYAGFLWMTARGDSEQVKKAQDILKDAIIGLVIVIAAYAITYFILYYIAKDYTTSSGL